MKGWSVLAIGVLVPIVALGCGESETSAGKSSRSSSIAARPAPGRVSALGRIEPQELVRLAGPSRPSAVIAQLLVEEGDLVQEGMVLAVLDTTSSEEAEIEVRRVELANAEQELERSRKLRQRNVSAQADLDRAVLRRDQAAARLSQAEVELEKSQVRSPVTGRILEIHAREGERVGVEGILELADVTPMFAVAEVYETDIGEVRVGQRALVTARALPDGETWGTVTRIGTKIGRRDVLGTDPVADTDARVVEVHIELDDDTAARLVNLQVEVVLQAEGEGPAAEG